MILYRQLEASAAAHPDRAAVRMAGEEATFAELLSRTVGLSGRLTAAGVRPGARLAVLGNNDITELSLYYAASRMDLTLAFLYGLRHATAGEVRRLIEVAAADVILTWSGAGEALAPRGLATDKVLFLDELLRPGGSYDGPVPALPTAPERTRCIMFTSGTTGQPKGVCINEAALAHAAVAVRTAMQIDAESRVLFTGFLWNMGSLVALATVAGGGTLVVPFREMFSGLPRRVREDRVTHAMLAPAKVAAMLRGGPLDPGDFASLRLMAYGGAPMPPATLSRAREVLCCDWLQGYGLTETSGPVTWLHESEHRAGLANTCGRPSPGHAVVALSGEGWALPAGVVGEIGIRGPQVMQGYFDQNTHRPDPVASRCRGWFLTGDLGEIDERGYVLLLGRKKDVVVRACGFVVYATEIEAVLTACEGVTEAAVFAWKAPYGLGEVPVAVVHGSPNAPASIVIEHCRQVLSPRKVPDLLVTSANPLPRNVSGKVRKNALRDTVAAWLLAGSPRGAGLAVTATQAAAAERLASAEHTAPAEAPT